jgi:hypothetical protein
MGAAHPQPRHTKENAMDQPQMLSPRPVAPDTYALNAYLPLPGLGVLPINAFVLRSAQPVLVDTGIAALENDFLSALASVIDPAELRWIWITHADIDHIGNLARVLELAPQARLVTTYLGMGKMSLFGLPLDRVYLLNPGQQLDVGDRRLRALAPPTFDAPETTALFDGRTHTLFSADSFGALMAEPVETANAMKAGALVEGMIGWASVDAPWLQMIDAGLYRQRLDTIRALGAKQVLSSHLPPAIDMTDTLLANVERALSAPAFVGPDQAKLEQMLSAA